MGTDWIDATMMLDYIIRMIENDAGELGDMRKLDTENVHLTIRRPRTIEAVYTLRGPVVCGGYVYDLTLRKRV